MIKPSLFGLRAILCATILFFICAKVYASHIVGADLYYNNVSGNIYQITVALYADCGPSSAGAFSTLPVSKPQICVYDGSTFVATVALVSTDTGIEVTHLCPGDTSQCVSPSSITPGVKRYIYSAVYTLPHTSAVWRFIYNGNNLPGSNGGRASAITNIAAAGSTVIQLIDTLNNIVYDNTSPVLAVSQQTFFCFFQHNNYNPMPADPDGDSLSLSLIAATNGSAICGSIGGPVAYTGTIWPGGPFLMSSNPLQVVSMDSFSFNPATGDMFFHPFVQRSVVVYNIREFRSGALVGTSQREMTVYVLNCDSTFPCLVTAPTVSLGISDQKNTGLVNVYPNPVTDEITIQTASCSYNSLIIANPTGQVMLRRQISGNESTANIRDLPAGMYYITLRGSNGVITRKFVKM